MARLAGACLAMCALSPVASAVPVVFDFEAVAVANAGDTPNVCQSSCPDQVVAGLPAGINGVRASSGTQAERVNIRSEADAINGSVAGTESTTFDNFFGSGLGVDGNLNNFAVLGDNDGVIHGSGTVSPGTGQSYLRLPFFVPAGTAALRFAFDFAFDGVDSSSEPGSADDVFNVKVTTSTGVGSPFTVYSRSSSDGFVSAHLGTDVLPLWTLLAADTDRYWWLEFELLEGGDGTHSAVGIDNVTVAPVPLPPSALLLGTALLGFGAARRHSGS